MINGFFVTFVVGGRIIKPNIFYKTLIFSEQKIGLFSKSVFIRNLQIKFKFKNYFYNLVKKYSKFS